MADSTSEQEKNPIQPQPKELPLGEWVPVFNDYDSYPPNTYYAEVSKIIPIRIRNIVGNIMVYRVTDRGYPGGGGESFYFDGDLEKAVVGTEEEFDKLERQDELRLIEPNLEIDYPYPQKFESQKWVWRVSFPSGTILEKRYDPQEDKEDGGFSSVDWVNPITGEEFIELLFPDTQAALGKVAIMLDVQGKQIPTEPTQISKPTEYIPPLGVKRGT